MPPNIERETLLWLQSLNLDLNFKDIKRDFSNGFIIAHILSKHFPNDIRTESFDNVTAKESKRNNWEYIILQMKQRGFTVEGVNFESIISCDEHASEEVCRLLEIMRSKLNHFSE